MKFAYIVLLVFAGAFFMVLIDLAVGVKITGPSWAKTVHNIAHMAWGVAFTVMIFRIMWPSRYRRAVKAFRKN